MSERQGGLSKSVGSAVLQALCVWLVLIALVVAALGCGGTGIMARHFAVRNPVGWTFKRPVTEVRLAMERAFRINQFRGMRYLTREDGLIATDSIFKHPENQFDGVLLAMGTRLGRSDVYHRNGEALEYDADFHIHVDALTDSLTRVTVRVLRMRVVVGEEWSIHGRAHKFVNVPATTIDEYLVIRVIGSELADSTMPDVRRPVGIGAHESMREADEYGSTVRQE